MIFKKLLPPFPKKTTIRFNLDLFDEIVSKDGGKDEEKKGGGDHPH